MATRFLPVLTDLPDLKPAPKARGVARSSAKRGAVRKNAYEEAEYETHRAVSPNLDRLLRKAQSGESLSPGDRAYIGGLMRADPGRVRAHAKRLRLQRGFELLAKEIFSGATRKNPIGKTKRGKRGGWVSKSGQGKFEHKRVRPPGHFVKGSLKTVPWAFITDEREQSFVRKKVGSVPEGAKVITGHIKSTVTAGRVKGTKVKWLATGVQAVLFPLKRAGRVNPAARKPHPPSPRKPARPAARKNPGRLVILNPADGSDPIAQTAKAMSSANRATLERIVHAASSAEITKLRSALVTYKKFHGCWPPSIERHHRVDGKTNRFLVGLGKADHVGYRINKEYPGSNKKGTPFRHHFSSGQDLATNEEGKGLAVLDRPGARRGTETTDWIRG